MPPTPIPTPLPPWARAVVLIFKTIGAGVVLEQFDHLGEMAPAPESEGDPPAQTWRKFVFTVDDIVSTETADRQTWSIELANITNGQVDSTWNDTDYATVWAQLVRLVTGTVPYMPNRLRYTQAAAYIRAFNPYTVTKPFVDSGEPEYFQTLTNTGVAVGTGASQVCTTITEVTAAKGHWGRMYLPTMIGALQPSGRFQTATIDALVTLWQDVYQELMDAQFFPVVPTTQVSKSPRRGLQVVTAVQADDVPDVMRSRRLSTTLYRKRLPVAP